MFYLPDLLRTWVQETFSQTALRGCSKEVKKQRIYSGFLQKKSQVVRTSRSQGFSIYGKIQESRLTETIPLICTLPSSASNLFFCYPESPQGVPPTGGGFRGWCLDATISFVYWNGQMTFFAPLAPQGKMESPCRCRIPRKVSQTMAGFSRKTPRSLCFTIFVKLCFLVCHCVS